MWDEQNGAADGGRRPLAKIAEHTEGFSGSDLMELCSRAAAQPVQEVIEQKLPR